MGNAFSSYDDDNIATLSSSYELSSSQLDVLTKAESLRGKARQLRMKAKEASEQSQYEYHHGSKSKAKTLSNEKNDLYQQMNQKNRQAAELIFEHYNQGRAQNVIDLHGLYVEEALEYLQQKVYDCRSNNISQLTVITGKGNNSPQNIAKIKPKVEKFASENHLKMIPYDGHVVLELTTKYQYQMTSNQNNNGCIIM